MLTDEILKLVEGYKRGSVRFDYLRSTIEQYAWQYAAACVAAERERGQKDAERYRWLRDVGDKTWEPLCARMCRGPISVDQDIDAAMEK
jgi:hypothetical protein